MSYLVLGRRAWNRRDFIDILSQHGSRWSFCGAVDELEKSLAHQSYRFLFFLHWSEKVPDEILETYECVCFHMTDVPFGRGGSPLQNLIARGHRETMLTALRMTSEIDAGPVYMKRPLSLEGSTAEEIYQRASRLSCEMALEIVNHPTTPQPQAGKPVIFRRRKRDESRLPVNVADVQRVFDHIRMLDAEDYPRAFLQVGNLRLEFSRAAQYHDCVRADVRISTVEDREDHQ